MNVLAIYAFDKLVMAAEVDEVTPDMMAMPRAAAVERALQGGVARRSSR